MVWVVFHHAHALVQKVGAACSRKKIVCAGNAHGPELYPEQLPVGGGSDYGHGLNTAAAAELPAGPKGGPEGKGVDAP